ncbi:hypothetical protein [Pedococcus sp. 5OH_020]|uniref:hypothetical protein n=1 Tax=Pedococcus sp. 5OH_020 TaxID=2989814 RepID=UPI0022E9A9C5|nr:hypothetical protein [Pedococcus sp. 5OH_020]
MRGAQTRRLTRADVGAWVFKGNPHDDCDYFGGHDGLRREPGSTLEGVWRMGSTYRSGLVGTGDPFVLWISGRHRPGIHEIGVVTEPVKPHPVASDGLEDRNGPLRQVSCAPFRSVLLSEPVSRSQLRADPVTAGCEPLRIPVMSNPTYLTPLELEALVRYLEPTELEAAGWSSLVAPLRL